jgi:hypothetical protein
MKGVIWSLRKVFENQATHHSWNASWKDYLAAAGKMTLRAIQVLFE